MIVKKFLKDSDVLSCHAFRINNQSEALVIFP